MQTHRSELDISRDRMRQADRAVEAQRRRATAAVGGDRTRAESNLAALVDLRLALGKSHALLIATELGVPHDSIVDTLVAL